MSLQINLASASYEIIIESGIRHGFGARIAARNVARIAVVTDSNVWDAYGEEMKGQLQGLDADITVLSPGENAKSHDNLMLIYRNWLKAGLTRSDLVLAFGGGVIGDMTGYAAATYMRGVPFIQIPTTLLSQVDSSIGGKVAVNLPEGKNLVGTFYHPEEVWIDPEYLKTLHERILKDGMAEVIKAACIGDAVLYGMLENQGVPVEQEALLEMISRALSVKKQLVEIDEKEHGLRKLLNFGHTIGHALEACGHYSRWTHGEAVAMGMIWVTQCSELAGLTANGNTARLTALVEKIGLPVESSLELDALMEWLGRDKKKSGNTMTLALMKEPGTGFLHNVPYEALTGFLTRKAQL